MTRGENVVAALGILIVLASCTPSILRHAGLDRGVEGMT